MKLISALQQLRKMVRLGL